MCNLYIVEFAPSLIRKLLMGITGVFLNVGLAVLYLLNLSFTMVIIGRAILDLALPYHWQLVLMVKVAPLVAWGFCGVASGLYYMIDPLYIAEFSLSLIRKLLMSIKRIFKNVGSMVLNLLNLLNLIIGWAILELVLANHNHFGFKFPLNFPHHIV